MPLQNLTVSVGKNVTFTCYIKHIQAYKVREERLSSVHIYASLEIKKCFMTSLPFPNIQSYVVKAVDHIFEAKSTNTPEEVSSIFPTGRSTHTWTADSEVLIFCCLWEFAASLDPAGIYGPRAPENWKERDGTARDREGRAGCFVVCRISYMKTDRKPSGKTVLYYANYHIYSEKKTPLSE